MLLITSGFPIKRHIAGIFIPELIKELNKQGCEVHVLTQNCNGNTTEQEVLWPGCKITFFPWRGGYLPLVEILRKKSLRGISLVTQFFINGIKVGKNICRAWHPDFIFAEWLVPAGLVALHVSRAVNIPFAARALGSDVLVAAGNPLIRPFVKHVAKESAVLFADGIGLCKITSELAGEKECHFAPTYRSLGDERSDFIPRDNGDVFTTATVGRLHVSKGHDVLIRAAKMLADEGVSVRSYIVGAGEEKESLVKMIREMGLDDRVILTGWLADGDIKALFRHVDCVVIPSRSESISLILGEAAAQKKPVIVTDAGDTNYLVERYNLGFVVPKESHELLADAIKAMMDTPNRGLFTARAEEAVSILGAGNAAKTIMDQCSKYLHNRYPPCPMTD